MEMWLKVLWTEKACEDIFSTEMFVDNIWIFGMDLTNSKTA